MREPDLTGEFKSPGGFTFGIQGWTWGEQRPTTITFLLDGTAKVLDQHGRPIRGTVTDNKPLYFANATHAQVIAALADERIDWRKLTWAGWPQLPYDKLKELMKAGMELPPTPIDELKKIRDTNLRRDALRLRREVDEAREKEYQATAEE